MKVQRHTDIKHFPARFYTFAIHRNRFFITGLKGHQEPAAPL